MMFAIAALVPNTDMCKKAGLIGDSMSSEESFRSTRDISCTEDIFNSERSYSAKNGAEGLWNNVAAREGIC